ncbi:MAG: gamma-glutamylcyclotransferase family protein [Pseudomonadota bacterium]
MTPWFFGYGSLVNTATHSYPAARPAQLVDHRRIWVAADRVDVVYLSVHAVPGHRIDGLIAQVPGADWQALDQRETGYARHDVTDQISSSDAAGPVAVYQVPPEITQTANGHHILLSYLDVVIQGFARQFGTAGAHAFFDSTDNWHIPVKDDRAAPRYPRAQRLTAEERALTDKLLAQVQ